MRQVFTPRFKLTLAGQQQITGLAQRLIAANACRQRTFSGALNGAAGECRVTACAHQPAVAQRAAGG